MFSDHEIKEDDEIEYRQGCSFSCHELHKKDLEIQDLQTVIKTRDKHIIELKAIRNNLQLIEHVKIPIVKEIEELIDEIYEYVEYGSLEILGKRIKIVENRLDVYDTNMKNVLDEIINLKNSLRKAIILKPVIGDDEEHLKYLKEQEIIEDLKLKHEGEILAFTKKENKLRLVAHSLYEGEIKKLIFKALKEKMINKDDKIFYR